MAGIIGNYINHNPGTEKNKDIHKYKVESHG